MVQEAELPTDPQALRQLVLELLSALQEKDQRISQLSSQLAALRRRLFGHRSEKLDSVPAEVPEPAAAEQEATPRNGHGRRRLPAALPRYRIEHHPAPGDRVCRECSVALKRIGEEVSEQLEYVPASLLVLVHARIKYACPRCGGNVICGSRPVRPIEKGLPGPGLLAHVLTSKYSDHLPLNRLKGIFQRQGVGLSRSTLCDWVAAGADLLEPLVLVMKDEVLASRKIHTDDTPVPVLDKDRTSTRTGRLWVYVGDPDHEHVVFDYTPGRNRDGPQRFLSGYKGYLQADAYAGYDVVYAGQEVIEVACWAHARRKFFDAMESDAARARIALAYIRSLYAVEKQSRDLDAAARRDLRLSEAKPQLDAFEAWLADQAPKVLPKSPMGEAIGYARAQWVALTRYLENGLLEPDNNRAERALRRVAVGRKSWMFAGSNEGGRRAAVIYSIIASCAVVEIDPYAYLRDVLARLPACDPEAGDLKLLTPKAWKAALNAVVAA